MTTNDHWMHQAVCTQVDPEIFFPKSSALYYSLPAMAVCARCPVQPQCLTHAQSFDGSSQGTTHGIYGGLPPADRLLLRKKGRIRKTTRTAHDMLKNGHTIKQIRDKLCAPLDKNGNTQRCTECGMRLGPSTRTHCKKCGKATIFGHKNCTTTSKENKQ